MGSEIILVGANSKEAERFRREGFPWKGGKGIVRGDYVVLIRKRGVNASVSKTEPSPRQERDLRVFSRTPRGLLAGPVSTAEGGRHRKWKVRGCKKDTDLRGSVGGGHPRTRVAPEPGRNFFLQTARKIRHPWRVYSIKTF